jgi:2-C-methyl-D-erythritol 4-phosphate cytidylyltransferase/2-C-methyl-D-erythritol 2,4-cyclodiphosphate synthase
MDDDIAGSAHPRDTLWRGQTPQAFHLTDILAAHEAAKNPADDDVAIAHAAGLDVTAVLGSELNVKITRPEDFALAARLLGKTMDIRVGNGFDVHKLGDGDHVILCGVKIPFDRGLIGHSDADVGMHAVTDAIFGAISEGDIGQWFPPSDPQWKGAASDIFLKKAVEVSVSKGFTISNLDCTLICEQPKIGPHANAMRKALSDITGLDIGRISVKATTSEKLGFTGRGEGIAAQATATLVKI